MYRICLYCFLYFRSWNKIKPFVCRFIFVAGMASIEPNNQNQNLYLLIICFKSINFMFDLIVGTANFVCSAVDNEKGTPNLSTPGQSSLIFLLITYKVHSFVNLTRFSPKVLFSKDAKKYNLTCKCALFS